jgi:hypothetical protein
MILSIFVPQPSCKSAAVRCWRVMLLVSSSEQPADHSATVNLVAALMTNILVLLLIEPSVQPFGLGEPSGQRVSLAPLTTLSGRTRRPR